VNVESLSVWTVFSRNGNAARRVARNASAAEFVSSGKNWATRSRVVERGVLEDLAAVDPVGHVRDVHLAAVPRPGHHVVLLLLRARPVSREEPRPLEDAGDAVHTRDAGDALPAEVPGQTARPVASPSAPPAQSAGHPGADLAGVAVRAPRAVGQAQPIPLTRGVAVPPLVVRLPGDPEEDAGVGDRAELLGLAEPVQPLPNALFPDRVSHG